MTIVALCWGECSLAGNVSKYDAGGVPDIHPKGWLLTLMQRQHDGDPRIPAAYGSLAVMRLMVMLLLLIQPTLN